MSTLYFAETALTDDGWVTDVLISVSSKGIIESLIPINKIIPTSKINGEVVRLEGTLLPGIANLHSHAFQRAFAGFSESAGQANDSFWSWRKIMYQFVEKLTPEQVYVIARQLYIEMLKGGYTSVAEFHYLHHSASGKHYDDPAEMSHQVINAAFDVGIDITHLPVYYRHAGFNHKPASDAQKRFTHTADDYYQLIHKLFKYYKQDQRIQIGIAPHSLRAVSSKDICGAIETLDNYNTKAPIHIHIAEQLAEVDDCIAHTGQRPVQHLYDNFDVNKRWCLIHATHINEQETWEIAQSGAVAGLCLTTEANLGDGIFPASFYLQEKGKFGIGSDSHITVSALEELRLLEYGQRLVHQQRAILCDEAVPSVGRTLYQGALEGGAQAVGRKTGKIAVGYLADWIILDGNNPSLFSKSKDQLIDSMIFACNANPIKDVFVSGKQVITSGNHALENESLLAFRKVLKEIVD
ncbi:MAG: formimidoylglutamate deiminase [Gammaproteobacteria bacterium]|nr:MAG: formimidoylglutamate deiminase [Gammaproteobacteria bacterium]